MSFDFIKQFLSSSFFASAADKGADVGSAALSYVLYTTTPRTAANSSDEGSRTAASQCGIPPSVKDILNGPKRPLDEFDIDDHFVPFSWPMSDALVTRCNNNIVTSESYMKWVTSRLEHNGQSETTRREGVGRIEKTDTEGETRAVAIKSSICGELLTVAQVIEMTLGITSTSTAQIANGTMKMRMGDNGKAEDGGVIDVMRMRVNCVTEPRWAWSEGLLVLLAIPDLSMPFNVIALSATAVMLFFGGVFRLATSRECHLEEDK